MVGLSTVWTEVIWGALIIVTSAMVGLWLMERQHRHLVYLAAAPVSMAVGILANILPIAVDYRVALYAAFFIVATVLATQGFAHRTGRTLRLLPTLIPVALGLISVAVLAATGRSLVWEVHLQDLTAAVVLTVGVHDARLLTNGRRGDRTLGSLTLFAAAYFACRSWLGLDAEALYSGEHSSFDVFTPPFVLVFVGIIVAIASTVIVQEVRDFTDRLRQERDTDALTGVLNRRGLQAAVERELTTSEHVPSSLVALDLDKFKPVNDRYGHAAGDEVLRRFSALLRTLIRTSDLVGRIGGDEFAVYLKGTTHDAAAGVAERIRREFAESAPCASPDPIPTTVSFGIAETAAGMQFADLLAAADDQLYRAKQSPSTS